MFVGVAIAATVVGVIVLAIALFLQRGREPIDLSPRNLLRTYLYAASFAGLIALVFGLAALGNYALAQVAGNEFVYGGTPVPPRAVPAPCPPGAVGCVNPPTPEDQLQRQREQNERRRNEELLRGLSFTVFGAVFYGAHFAARRGIAAEERRSGLRRAYLMLGTATFGLATIVLVPTGVYQALANAILPRSGDFFRPGVADSLSPGIVSLVVWLIFLRLVVSDFRGGTQWAYAGPHHPARGGGPAGTAPGGDVGPGGAGGSGVREPRPVAPSARSAGAEAIPPDDTEI